MARTVTRQVHTAKRGEVLDAAPHLVSTRGHESITIQGFLDALRTSKGAFYLYFGSEEIVKSRCAVSD
jgi:AcrR family transcriptional regulator